jgi:chorismate dehydratase
VELLRVLFKQEGIDADFRPTEPVLAEMLSSHDAALLIGDTAVVEAVVRREFDGRRPYVTDLGAEWHRWTSLPFTFAVLASKADTPPSATLVAKLRQARERGLAQLHRVVKAEAKKHGLSLSQMHCYLGNFRYHLQSADKEGLFAFGTEAVPGFEVGDVHFWNL